MPSEPDIRSLPASPFLRSPHDVATPSGGLVGRRTASYKLTGMTGTVHLVQGFLGAGKTTFAKKLAAERGAIRFSVDEIYLRLFADGPTYELDQRALTRVLDMLNDLWPQVAAAGVEVVLDFGFWRRALRDEVRRRAAAVAAPVRHYWLRCAEDVALERCLRRNGEPNAFLLSETGFQELKARFEPPGADEIVTVLDTGRSASGG